jgi:phage protein D
MVQADRNSPLVPAFGITLNGERVDTDIGIWVVNVVVEDDLDVPSMFTLELASQQDANGVTAWTDDTRFSLGGSVQISFGYGDELESVFSGEITGLEPVFSMSGVPTLLVRGYDKRHRLNGPQRTRVFLDQTDSDIAHKIGSDAGLSTDVTDSEVTHPYVFQAAQTDMEFLLARARRIHFELLMDGDTLVFRPVANDEAEVATLTPAEDLLEFRPRLSLVPITALTVLGWDEQQQQMIFATARAPDQAGMGGEASAAEQAQDVLGEEIETLAKEPVAGQAEADQMAAGRFNAAALDFIRGDGRCLGRTDVRAGVVVRVDDIGTRFSGEYYVISATHSYTRRDGYITEFQVRRNAS